MVGLVHKYKKGEGNQETPNLPGSCLPQLSVLKTVLILQSGKVRKVVATLLGFI